MATDFSKYGSPILGQKPDTQTKTNRDGSTLQDISVGVAKSGLSFSRNVAGALQDVGQRVLAGITPGQDLGDIKQTTGFKSLSDQTQSGQQVKQILEPQGSAEKFGSFIGDVLQFAVPASRVAKATKGLGSLTRIGGQVASDIGVSGVQTGSPKEALKTGVVSGTLSTIPVLGKLISPKVAQGIGGLSKRIEEINLRLSPTDKLKLQKQQGDVLEFLSQQKLTGTPTQRYTKALEVVDSFEDKIQGVLKSSGKEYTKDEIVQSVKNIPEEYLQTVENPEVYRQMERITEDFVEFINRQPGDTITASRVNQFKRNYAKNARNKAGDVVTNEAREAISDGIYTLLQKDIPSLKPINKEYAKALLGTKLLGKAIGKNELGLIGNIISIASGTTVGGAVGGPVGGAVGAAVGPQLAKTVVGTPTRSRVGAGLQVLSDYLKNPQYDPIGNVIIPKAIIDAITNQ